METTLEKLTLFANSIDRPLEEIIRQYLLEAILRRLVNSPLADLFVLRGGMLMRMWVSPKVRPADDLDFLALFPYNLTETVNKVREFLSNKTNFGDGVEFYPLSVEGEATWIETPSPGVRLTMKGIFAGEEFASKIDVGFGDPLVPEAVKIDYPTFISGNLKALACRIETALGWKLHGLIEFREKRWRAKDLYDLFLLIDYIDPFSQDLLECIKIAFSSRNTSLSDVVKMFNSPTWWTKEKAQIRWQQFQTTKNLSIELPLLEIVESVKKVLLPVVERGLAE